MEDEINCWNWIDVESFNDDFIDSFRAYDNIEAISDWCAFATSVSGNCKAPNESSCRSHRSNFLQHLDDCAPTSETYSFTALTAKKQHLEKFTPQSIATGPEAHCSKSTEQNTGSLPCSSAKSCQAETGTVFDQLRACTVRSRARARKLASSESGLIAMPSVDSTMSRSTRNSRHGSLFASSRSRIQDVPVPAQYTTAVQQQNTGLLDEDEDTMDFEDGGVALDTEDGPARPDSRISSNTPEMEALYHQHPITETENTLSLWQLPGAPFYVHFAQLGEKYGITHPIPFAYHKSCWLIRHHWQCEPAECIPAECRAQTPYSMAMLSNMRRLACHTKQDLTLAHSLLLQSWRERNGYFEASREHSYINLVETEVSQDFPNCERKIQQNGFGLMISDIAQAFRTLRFMRNQARKQARGEVSQYQQAERETKRQMRLAKKQVKYEAKLLRNQTKIVKQKQDVQGRAAKYAALQPERLEHTLLASFMNGDIGANGDAVVPPNSPVATTHEDGSLGQPDRSRDGNAVIGSERSHAANGNAEHINYPSKHDRQDDRSMSFLLNKMMMDSEKGPNKNQLKRLQAGGFTRRRHPPVIMPSEKVDLTAMAPLHTTGSSADATSQAPPGQSRDGRDIVSRIRNIAIS